MNKFNIGDIVRIINPVFQSEKGFHVVEKIDTTFLKFAAYKLGKINVLFSDTAIRKVVAHLPKYMKQ